MRRERSMRGGRGGSGRGGRGRRDGRDGRDGRGGHFGGSRRGGGRRNSRGPVRHSAESGNLRERIAIESGFMVLIDQFMLANPQFIEKLRSIMDEEPSCKDEVIRSYGGTVVEVHPDRYRIERDPFAFSIVIHPEGHMPVMEELKREGTEEKGRVLVDTRCLAMIDRELLDDASLLEKYQQLWFSGQDKACRDLLRDNGGAVRYGFSRLGDELGVYCLPEEDVVALWPDVDEPAVDGQ